jgi:GT2 family glycosyltransferase
MTKVSSISPCYKMDKYMEGFLESVASQTHKDLEIVLDHNDPSEKEIDLVEKHNQQYDNVTHIKVDGVDPIGISMNRCIEYSEGDYLCMWNIDDLRAPDSIEVMAKTLDDNPDVDFVYGNYYNVPKFKTTEGRLVNESGNEKHLMTGMILGPFFMFRKSLLKKTGVFDEQLFSGADYDLAMRFARNGKGKHIPHVLGYYLNEGLGASTRPNSKQPIERTVVEMRYNMERVLDSRFVPYAQEYDIENIHKDEMLIPVSTYIP